MGPAVLIKQGGLVTAPARGHRGRGKQGGPENLQPTEDVAQVLVMKGTLRLMSVCWPPETWVKVTNGSGLSNI